MTKHNLSVYFSFWFQGGKSIMAAKAGSRKKEREQEVGRSYKPTKPGPSNELPPASSTS